MALPEVTTQNKNDKATAITTAIAALKLITDPPSIISIELAPSTSVWYGIGDTDDLKIKFDEDIKIVGASPSITLESADFNLTLTYKSHDGAEMIVSYTLEEGVTPALLFGASYTLGNTSESLICDLQDNCITDPSALIPSEAIVDRDGPAIFSELSATWDVERPTITGLVLAPEFAEESYKIGDTVVLEVTFSEEVFVSSTPILTMGTNQEFDVVLTYRGSGETSDKILVDYIVQENVDLEDLRLAQYQEFDLVDGFITDIAGNLPILAPDAGVLGGAVASLAGITIYDVTRPRVSDITIPGQNGILNALTRDGLYLVGESLPIRLQFDDDIFITNSESITITMNSGGTAFLIDIDDDYIEFAYMVQPGDSSTAMDLNVASIQLNGALIKDVNGNDASLELPEANEAGSLDINRDITVDASAPTSLQVIPGPGSLSVTVDAPTWSPTVYTFEVSANGVTWQVISSTSTSATIGGLLGGTNYQVRVAGVAIIPDLENRVLVNGRSKMVVAGFVSGSGRTDSVAGTPGPAGPAGPAGAAAPASTASNQALAIAIANAESATALATEKAKALEIARVAAELAKTQALEAAQMAKNSSEKLAIELASLARKSNTISVKALGNSTQIVNNLSDEFAKSEAVIQIKQPRTTKYVTIGKTKLNGSGDKVFKFKGKIKKGSYIRILIEGVVVKTHIV